jgi:hypothetical protein
MDHLISMYVESGAEDSIVFEVDRNEFPDDLVLASPRLGGVTAQASITFADAMSKLKPPLERVVHLLRELSPEHIEVEFGLKIGGETGIIVSKGTAEVNFTVRMSWDRTSREKVPHGTPVASR